MKVPECFQLPWLYVVTELQSGRNEMCSKEEWSYEKLGKYNVRLFSKLEVDGAFKLNRKNRYKGARNSDATVKRKQRPHAIEAQWIKVVVFQC